MRDHAPPVNSSEFLVIHGLYWPFADKKRASEMQKSRQNRRDNVNARSSVNVLEPPSNFCTFSSSKVRRRVHRTVIPANFTVQVNLVVNVTE